MQVKCGRLIGCGAALADATIVAMWRRRDIFLVVCLLVSAAKVSAQQLSVADGIRVGEFYRLAPVIEDRIWPEWSKTPAPLLLISADSEFLTHYPDVPADFKLAGGGFYVRPRQFPIHLEATFPAFGPLAVIVIGEPQNTASKTSTSWLVVLMHEHFHQLQDGTPGYFDAVANLGLSRGDKTGIWMLNYPFPYAKPEIAQSFGQLRDLLLKTVGETDPSSFRKDASEYVAMRRRFFAQLSSDDHKYLSFQLWQEGIARYTQIMAAEAAASYKPTAAFAALPDYESFDVYAKRARAETLNELRSVDLMKAGRGAIYPFGAAEGLLLDRLNPRWKDEYFTHLLSTDALFVAAP
ncbi:hypothetical protein [Granulicella arctica]|uniref:Uncharacterized protein n=1 Tax=Granulicella arctica TaxID=940613 RepID=A0A7Y9TMN0_9BACT|nr:hypothetical protein [Granulicella arctica]NYF81267.1 hypothetical protein [Granulicella arctica]